MRTATSLLLIAAGLFAQEEPSGPPAGMDVHVIAINALSGGTLPEINGEAVLRFVFDGSNRSRNWDEQWGTAPGIRRLRLNPEGGDAMNLEFRFHGRRMSWSGSDTVSARGDVKAFSHYQGWPQRTRFGRAFRHLLFVPWKHKPETLEAWSGKEYAEWLVRHVMDLSRIDHEATYAAMQAPLQRLLDAPLLVEFREWVRDLKGVRNRRSMRNQRMSRSMAYMRPGDLILGLRLAAGDPDAVHDMRNRSNNWALRSSLHLAFLQIGDPESKGEAGWMLVADRHDSYGSAGLRERSLIVPYHDLVEAGDAIIPGTDAQRTERRTKLATWVAEKDAVASLLVILVAALGLFAVAFAARRAALRLAI